MFQKIVRLLMWAGIITTAAACGGVGGGAAAVVPSTTLVLTYNADSIVIQNIGENVMGDPVRLTFVRGTPNADSDDYAASSMTTGALTSGSCYTLTRRGSNPLRVESCTVGSSGDEQMTNITGLFWRAEPIQAATFDVMWDATIIAQCPTFTIADTETKQCTFVYPPEVEAE